MPDRILEFPRLSRQGWQRRPRGATILKLRESTNHRPLIRQVLKHVTNEMNSTSLLRLIICTVVLAGLLASPLHASPQEKQGKDAKQVKQVDNRKTQSRRQGKQKQKRGKRDPQRRNKPTIYWPSGVEFNKDIPTPKEFFGFEVGHRHLRHDQVAAYMRELARVSDRVAIQQYAQTHGGRPLLLLTITATENHNRLGDIKRRHQELAQANSGEQPELADLPVVMNMGYGVHGDEPSATNTSPLVAHYLAAAEGDEIERILKNSVILLDPSLNPDGFDRFARWANTFRGNVPNPDSAHIEHRQGWPPGRVNYYWFDLNRDWLPLQHPESQGRMRWYHQWKPNVVLDFHEMGTNSTFFFQPGIPERKNPLTPQKNVELTRAMGQFHANALDQTGSLYFTQELFDDFYMGKGSTYPDLHGAVGILFEQGSSRGHVQESANGIIRFSDTISNQFTASLSSLRGAAELRKRLLQYKHDFYQDSLEQAEKAKFQAYAFALPHNQSRLQQFADILIRHDIDCFWVTEDSIVDDQVVKSDSLIVPTKQSEYQFLRSLIERREKFRESIFYDVSAWTLPLAFNLQQRGLKSISELRPALRSAKLGEKHAGKTLEQAEAEPVAWFVDWRDDASVKVLQQLLKRDVHVRVAMRPLSAKTTAGNKAFPVGTLSVPMRLKQNQAKSRAINQILQRATRNGVRVDAVQSGLASAGVDLGSNNFPRVEKPAVAMLIGSGVSAYQAGAAWHQLDHRIGMPVSLLASERAGSTDFSKYSTVVLVSGSYELGRNGLEKLRRFVREGGTLIAISGGTAYAQQEVLQLPPSQVGAVDEVVEPENAEGETPKFSEARRKAALDLVSGAIFATEIDTTHPLMFGFENKRLPVFRGSTSLLDAATPEVSNPARYPEKPLLAGYASQKNEDKIAGSSAVTVHAMGGGQVILIVDDPNFRAFWPATSRVFMNAIYFGPFANAR